MALKISSISATGPRAILVRFDQPVSHNAALLSAGSYTLEPALPYGIASVTPIGASSVRLNLPVNMRSGQAYTLTASTLIESIASERLDSEHNSDTFIGIGDAPELLSAEALDGRTIRLGFSEPMDVARLTERERYGITSEATGQTFPVLAATPAESSPGSGLFSQVDLTVERMTSGATHWVAASGMLDAAGNPQLVLQELDFAGIANLPKMLSATINPITRLLDVTFDTAMDRASVSASNAFSIISQAGVPRVYPSSAQLDSTRRIISLTISTSRAGALYGITANAAVLDAYGNAVDSENDSATFSGVGDSPVILRIVPISQNRIDVVFSARMRDNAAIRDHSRYSLSGGATVVAVAAVEGDTVKLVTSNQEPGALYNLTIE